MATIIGNNGKNVLFGTDQADDILGLGGDDNIFGRDGNDAIWGGCGSDHLFGDKGDDLLDGGTGGDKLSGGAGDDALIGGAGADMLSGGSGDDTFVYLLASDSPAASGWDRISDFTQDEDKIDLAVFRGAMDLTWNADNGPAAWGVWYEAVGTSIFVFADTTGDGTADLRIQLNDADGLVLTSSDFIGVGGMNAVPMITSDGGGDTANVFVPENSTAGTDVDATDADAGDVLTYSIVGGADAASFSIDPSTGVLTINAAPDFEHPADAGGDNVYDVIVQVSDEHGGTDTQSIAVMVENVNELDAMADADPDENSVAENSAAGTLVQVTAFAFDPDGNPVTYSLTDDAGGLFAIDADGVVRVAGTLDFESAAIHSITVQATDGTLVQSRDFTISVTNVNELDAIADADDGENSVAENSAVGTLVSVTAFAFDPDGNPVTYSLTDDAGGLFAIDADGVVRVAGTLDFESAAIHSITVQATDGTLVQSRDFTISVTDVTEGGNQTPVAGDDYIITNVGVFEGFDIPEWALLANDSDPDGNTLDVSRIVGIEGAGSAVGDPGTGANGFVTFIDTNESSTDAFSYKITDGVTVSGLASVDVTQQLGNTLTGDAGDNILIGGMSNGSTTFFGGDGNDVLIGGASPDTMDGGSGGDILYGGGGDDILTGGSGSDLFNYDALSDRDMDGDHITDFQAGAGGDVLDLADLLNGFDGYDGANALSGGYLRFVESGGNTLVQVDDTGSGDGDQYMTLITLDNFLPGDLGMDNLFL